MKNIESLTTKPVSVLAILDEPYKVLDNKDTYIKSADPEKGKVLICKVIDIDRVERKSGTAVILEHFYNACAEADKKSALKEIEPFPCLVDLGYGKPAFAVSWPINKEDTQTVREFFYSGPGAHILDTLHDCLVALPSGWDYYDKPQHSH